MRFSPNVRVSCLSLIPRVLVAEAEPDQRDAVQLPALAQQTDRMEDNSVHARFYAILHSLLPEAINHSFQTAQSFRLSSRMMPSSGPCSSMPCAHSLGPAM